MMTAARRYAPNKSVEMKGPILAALGDKALNVTAICQKLNRSSDDSHVRYCLKMLTSAGQIQRDTAPGITGTTYVYRRKF